MTNVQAENWIAVDWGTTNLRCWLMNGATAKAEAKSGDGMNALTSDAFEAALLRLAEPWLKPEPTLALVCGMAGARQGWVEAPYRATPIQPLAGNPVAAPMTDGRLRAYVVPGLKQVSPADVLRGEETQIAGFLSLNPGWDGVACLPGTHTKWALISAGEVVGFQTFMTGELFAALGTSTILRQSVADEGWDDNEFLQAFDDAVARPERLAAQLFSLRARYLLEDAGKEAARARLSGMLIGSELAAAKPYWLGQNLAIIGPDHTARLYAAALDRLGAPAAIADGTRMTQAGLTTAWRKLTDQI